MCPSYSAAAQTNSGLNWSFAGRRYLSEVLWNELAQEASLNHLLVRERFWLSREAVRDETLSAGTPFGGQPGFQEFSRCVPVGHLCKASLGENQGRKFLSGYLSENVHFHLKSLLKAGNPVHWNVLDSFPSVPLPFRTYLPCFITTDICFVAIVLPWSHMTPKPQGGELRDSDVHRFPTTCRRSHEVPPEWVMSLFRRQLQQFSKLSSNRWHSSGRWG